MIFRPTLYESINAQESKDRINDVFRRSGRANIDSTISDTFHGINISGRNPPIALNTENQGYTFFTRPTMNMSYDNLVVDRVMSNLLDPSENSIARMIRSTLDWRLKEKDGVEPKGIDPLQAFIPLLTNNLISMSPFQDFTLNTMSTPPGLYREVYSYTDDIPYNYGAYDITATFRNLSGDPITFMMLMWGWYQGLVYEGVCMPYPEHIILNQIDYQTRIYRLVMDRTKRYVTRIAATGVSWPTTAPIGNIFNVDGDGQQSPFTTANDQIAVNLRALGFTFYDNILVYEFNKTVTMFNPGMSEDIRHLQYAKLDHRDHEIFNYRAYPYINRQTLELEWYVPKELYQ